MRLGFGRVRERTLVCEGNQELSDESGGALARVEGKGRETSCGVSERVRVELQKHDRQGGGIRGVMWAEGGVRTSS